MLVGYVYYDFVRVGIVDYSQKVSCEDWMVLYYNNVVFFYDQCGGQDYSLKYGFFVFC